MHFGGEKFWFSSVDTGNGSRLLSFVIHACFR
jgi:hypothetical protein